jgi:hypothetical protein
MLKAILLDNEQVKKYGGLLTNISDYGKNIQTEEFEGTDINSAVIEDLDNSEVESTASAESGASEQASNLSTDSNKSEASLDSSEEITELEPSDEFSDAEYENEYDYRDALDTFYYDANELEKDALALMNKAVENYEETKNGFSASITLEKDNLVFFSIPYDEGWSATVNGKKVDVERVNKGFMAVPVTAGESQIEFTYKTPGLYHGALITLSAIFVWVLYTVISAVLAKTGKLAIPEYPEGEKLLDKYAFDAAQDAALQSAEENEKEFDVEITDDSVIYGYDENTANFNRGFWINTEIDDEEPEISLSELLSEENNQNNKEEE